MLSLRNFCKPKDNNSGFTVVELLIAMVIILLMATVITPVVVFTTHSAQYNRAKVTAVNIANEKIEEIRSMKFADIGLIGGNPKGSLPATQTVTMNERDFIVNTYVTWEVETPDDIDSCLSFLSSGNAGHLDWDIKKVTVEVINTGHFQGGNTEIKEEITTLISRDHEQPLLTGANLRVCIFHGWDYMISVEDEDGIVVNLEHRDYNPAENVEVTIEGNNDQFAYTSLKGAASFLDIIEGDHNQEIYEANVDPSSLGMIVFPGSYPRSGVTVSDGSTEQLFAFVERPASINIRLKDSEEEQPIEINDAGFTGSLTLHEPYGGLVDFDSNGEGAGRDIIESFSGSDSEGNIKGTSGKYQKLWPFPSLHANAYAFTSIDIPGYLIDNDRRVWDEEEDQLWSGSFDEGPNSTKNLTIYLHQYPPVDLNETHDWLRAASVTIDTGLEYPERVAIGSGDCNILRPATFYRDKPNDKIQLPASNIIDFIATQMVFYGSGLEIGNHSNLILHGNYFLFKGEGEIELSSSGTITLKLLNTANCDDEFDEVMLPAAFDDAIASSNGECKVKTHIAPKSGIIEKALLGSEIKAPSSQSTTRYGKVIFEKDVYINGPQGGLIVSAGGYYFPDNFNLLNDWEKSPEEGGLIIFGQLE